MEKQELEKCLSINPFEGDFGDGEKHLSDKIVKAAKEHKNACHICCGNISKGEFHRVKTDVAYGEIESYRFCQLCCIAMMISNEDAGKSWESRIHLHLNGFLQLGDSHLVKDQDKTEEEILCEEILAELTRARLKFPGKNVTFAAMIEEVGEVATALFEESKDRVRKEAIQVAVMAMRVVLDGDHTFDSWRAEKGLDKL